MGILEKGVSNATEKYGQITDSLSDLVSSKRQYVIKQIANIFLLLIILIVFGCFDFLHLEFHYEYLSDANYWANITLKTIADICAYNIGVNFIVDDVIKRNKVLQKLKTQYEKLNSLKQEDFSDFIERYNKSQRIKSYKNSINHQIYKLNKKSKRADRLLYQNKSPEVQESKKTNKYCIKRLELEQMKTDEFILENIENLDVRYQDIDPSIFEIEINGAEKIVQNKVTGSLNKGRAIASMSTMVGVIAFSMFFQSISLAPNKQEFENGVVAAAYYAAKISTDIAIIIWQFIRGVLGTHRIVSRQLTNPLAERLKVLKLYYEDRIKRGLPVPTYYLNLKKEGKVEEETQSVNPEDGKEFELTKEEFDRIIEMRKSQGETE